ncbi:MAG: aminotransferase class V-fold PLP-dependent enzyme [Actinomycetota bacterium]
MSFKHLFSRFLGAVPDRLHFAAHSHHPWPDVTYDAHLRAWEDASRLMDDKWDDVFGVLIPDLRRRLARVLNLPDPDTLVFAPNTHELVARIFSGLRPPIKVVTSDGEFHSFERQLRRWEEADQVSVVRVTAEPFDTFAERFAAAAGDAGLVYLSQVFFDSGFEVTSLPEIAASARAEVPVVVDGYHGFMAIPVDLSGLAERVFYLAGGYKYAMAGEGACFMHCPPGFLPRPVDTGWYAGFSTLANRADRVAYGAGGDRFWGATFDPSGLYRLRAVFELLEAERLDPAAIHLHVAGLQASFLDSEEVPGELIPEEGMPRGNFLTFRTDRAAALYRWLHHRQVITDHRGDRLRIGFGLYHDPEDVGRLVRVLGSA